MAKFGATYPYEFAVHTFTFDDTTRSQVLKKARAEERRHSGWRLFSIIHLDSRDVVWTHRDGWTSKAKKHLPR